MPIPMATTDNELKVYEAGPLTVLGFGGREILEEINIAYARDQVFELIDQYGTEVLAFDLTGVRFVPSGMLGLLASVYKRGVKIHLYNPSEDVIEVLEVTKLKDLVEVHEIEVDRDAGEES